MRILCFFGWHRYRNTSDGLRHGAICIRCRRVAGNMWTDGRYLQPDLVVEIIGLKASHAALVEALEDCGNYQRPEEEEELCFCIPMKEGGHLERCKKITTALATAFKLMEADDAE